MEASAAPWARSGVGKLLSSLAPRGRARPEARLTHRQQPGCLARRVRRPHTPLGPAAPAPSGLSCPARPARLPGCSNAGRTQAEGPVAESFFGGEEGRGGEAEASAAVEEGEQSGHREGELASRPLPQQEAAGEALAGTAPLGPPKGRGQ